MRTARPTSRQPRPRIALPLCIGVLALAAAWASCDPVARWSFDNDPEGLVKDSGPSQTDGVISAAVHVLRQPGSGRALHFGGGDSVVTFPPSPAIAFDSSQSFAVAFSIRTTQRSGFATPVMAKDKPGGAVSYSFCIGRKPGALSFEVWSWGSTKLTSPDVIADGQWHRVLGAYDAHANMAYLVVDGRIHAASLVGNGGPHSVALRLGNNIDSHQPFVGDLDDVSIERGLPPEVKALTDQYRLWVLLENGEAARAQQAYLDRMAAPKFYPARSADEWKTHAAEVREHVLDCLGLRPLPERLPLNVHYAGIVEHEAYTLKRVYWQTWPSYHASGWLYLPKNAKSPAPAVLNPHGHWENGARHPVVQARCISLAMKGYVALAVDSVHAYNWSAGLVPLTVMTWNNIRAMDLLCSLPEVDPKRLGCTGCSGGAQQTFYLMALEDRLDVAIPVCMVSEWRRILATSSAHCSCNHVPGILSKTDTPELAACFAPRPSLMICVTQDWTARLPREGFPQIKHTYDLFGAGDKTACTQYDWGHDYSLPMREQAYGVLNRELMGVTDPAQAQEPEHTPETLAALAALDGPPAGALPPESAAAELVKRTGFDKRAPGADTAQRLVGIRTGFAELTHEVGISDGAGVRLVGDATEVDGCRVERMVVTSEREVPVPVVVVSSGVEPNARRRPSVVLVSPSGKASLLSTRWELVRSLATRGLLVCVPDVRPYGELGINRDAQDLNGVVFGRPELAVAAHDTHRVAEHLRSRPDADPKQVACVGFDEAAIVALAAGVYDQGFSRVAALRLGDTYAARDRRPRCPRILTVGDLPQLAAVIAPRSLWIQGATQLADFAWTAQAFAQLGAARNLRQDSAAADDASLTAWLMAGLPTP